MATIDLIVLGMLKKEELSAYDIQKLVEYRNISKWVISKKPIHLFLDFNAVIVNLESMPKEEQRECLEEIEMNIDILLNYLENNQKLKEKAEDVPATGMAVLCQQITLAQAIKAWIDTLKEELQ